MRPCEKYMMDASRDSEDITFKPFNPSSYIPNFQNTPLPVMFWGNMVINPVTGNVSNFPMPYISSNKKSSTDNASLGYNYVNTGTYGNMGAEGSYNKMVGPEGSYNKTMGTESQYNNMGAEGSYNKMMGAGSSYGNMGTGSSYGNIGTGSSYNNMGTSSSYYNPSTTNYSTSTDNVNTSNTDNIKYGSGFSNFNQIGNMGTSNNVPSYDINYPDETSQSNLYSYNKTNSSSPTSTTSKYDSVNVDISNSDITEVLKSLDATLNESDHLMRNINDGRIDSIYNNILDEDSNITSLFNAYKIPKPISKLILTRTIKTALNYSDNTANKNKVGD